MNSRRIIIKLTRGATDLGLAPGWGVTSNSRFILPNITFLWRVMGSQQGDFRSRLSTKQMSLVFCAATGFYRKHWGQVFETRAVLSWPVHNSVV